MKDLTQEQETELIPPETILCGWRGSIANGMNQSDSDKDIMSVYMGDIEFYLGFGGKDVIEKIIGEYDSVSYEYRKFVSLLTKGNPNVLTMLWLEPNHYINRHVIGQQLIDNRELFVSKAAYHSFVGYAYSQLKRMEHVDEESGGKGYMGKKRKEEATALGYDARQGSHCIRLLKMGIEFMTEGKLYVQRPDAPQLLDIKSGKWKLDELKEYANHLFRQAETAYVNSKLPATVDTKRVEKLMMNSIYHWIREHR